MLGDLVPEIIKTSDLIKEISSASSEQEKGVDQMNIAINQLNEVVQTNASSSEEMAATSEELNAKSDFMLQTVSFFNIGKSSNSRKNQKNTGKKEETNIRGKKFEKKERENYDDENDFPDQEGGFKEF